MFKAGSSIIINADKKVKNKNGIFVAPMINFNGLVLRSENPIPKEVLEFFHRKGAIVQSIEEDGDRLIRLIGEFEISKSEIEQFLKNHLGLALIKESDLKGVREARNFQRHVEQRTKNRLDLQSKARGIIPDISTKVSIFQGKEFIAQVSPAGFHVGNDCKLTAEEACNLENNEIYAGRDVFIKSKTCKIIGADVQNIVGNLSDMMGENININGNEQLIIQDTILRAKVHMTLTTSGDFEVSQANIIWLNKSDIPSLSLDFAPLEPSAYIASSKEASAGDSKSQKDTSSSVAPLELSAGDSKSQQDAPSSAASAAPSSVVLKFSDDLPSRVAEKDWPQVIEALMQCKAINDGDKYPKCEVALRRAAATGKKVVVIILLNFVKDLNIDEAGPDSGKTAIQFAKENNQMEIVEILQQYRDTHNAKSVIKTDATGALDEAVKAPSKKACNS